VTARRFVTSVGCPVTGSTQAGIALGFAADGRADRVIGIDALAKPAKTRAITERYRDAP
jgi:1-aminocyclopropane-1-carboxylate deaminase